MKNEIVLFEAKDGKVSLPVQLNEETVWLTRMQMAELFGVTPQNITLHLQNVYKTGELERAATSKDFLLVQQEGSRSISRMVNAYNLDAIISVGYRVNSVRATQFRIWATKVLKEYLIRGYAVNKDRLRQLGQAIDVMKRVSNSLDTEQVLDVGHDRRSQAHREGDDGQPRHDFSGVKGKKGTETMKPIARMILVSSLALAAMAMLSGCEKWQRSVEARNRAARDGLESRKAFLAAALPESERVVVPEDFYAYEGLRDWFRMPLVFPYQLQAIDSTLCFHLMRYNGKASVRDPNKSSENVQDRTSSMTALSHLSFDRTTLLFKKEGVGEYGMFSFVAGEFAFFATEAELWSAAQGRGFCGPKSLIPVATAFENYWAFRKPWLFASMPKATTE